MGGEAADGRAAMSERSGAGAERSDGLAALGWFALAAALRFLALGRFSLWGDEVYSLDNSLDLFGPRMVAADLAFPVFFALERLVLELAGLAGPAPDPQALQFVLRLLPALAGSIAAAAAFRSSRGFLGRRERHVLAALVAFSPWFLYFSQLARFYSLVLAFCIPATFELMRAQREGSFRRALAGVTWIALAIGTHPTAGLLLLGELAAVGGAALLRVRPLSRAVVPLVALPLLMAVPALLWPSTVSDTIGYKLRAQDAAVESFGGLLLGIGWNVGPVIGALGVLGLPTLWRRDRELALHVVLGAGVPTALMLALAALHKSVEQRYLIAVVPLALLPAAAFIGELSDRLERTVRGAAVAVPALALAAWAPGIVSELIDGNRHDLAGALRFVTERLRPGDGVIVETHGLARRYLPDSLADEQLLEAPPPSGDAEWRKYESMWGGCPRLWIVIPADFEEKTAETRSFHRWAWEQGRLAQELWRPRLDYHQNRLRVFVVEPERAMKWHPRWQPRGG